MSKSYPTPPSTSFHPSIKVSNYPYVYMGELNEDHYNNDIIQRYKGVTKTGNKNSLLHYKVYDWVNKEYYVELKSRNNDYEFFKTTMIGYNKLEEWKKDKTGRKYYFLFGFLDGLYEWELNKENYEKIGGDTSVMKTNFKNTKSYSTYNTNKEHLYIPIHQLKNINNKGCLVPDDLVCNSKRISTSKVTYEV